MPTKGLIYYSDCRGDEKILSATRRQLIKATTDLPIISITLAPLDFGKNTVLPLERGILTMFRQILTGLEQLDTDIAFLVEHDVLYHPSHFKFTPPQNNTYYYNENTWKIDAISGKALFYYTKQVSGLCANRELLLQHYKTRVARVETHGYERRTGYEPGCHQLPTGIDNFTAEKWMSEYPNLDIRHQYNLTANRWKQSQFRRKSTCQGWTWSDDIPGWAKIRGRFNEFLEAI